MSGDVAVILGAGPVGRALAEQLAGAGRSVRLVSRSGRDRGVKGVAAVSADLMDAAAIASLVSDANTVFHAAAPAYHRWAAEFPALQESILRGMQGSDAVLAVVENLYGYGVAGRLHEDMPLAAMTRKGQVRARMAEALLAAHRSGRVRAVIVRAADFIGPGVMASVYGDRFWPRLVAGKGLGWIGNPDALHSVSYVPDVARTLIRLAAEPAALGRAWHAPSPEARAPREVAEEVAARLGHPPPRFTPVSPLMLRLAGLFAPAAREMVEMIYSFETDFVIDDTAARIAFGLVPTGWDDILDRTLAYWRGRAA